MTDQLPLGVHFGLPADAYLNDPGLGSGDIRRLYANPPDYWWQSPHNPNRPNSDSTAAAFGRAFHVYLLEGHDAFRKQYAIAPEKADYGPELLDNMNDFKRWLAKRGHSPGASKKNARHQIRALNKSVPIWDEITEDFERALEGKEAIKRADAQRITAAADFMLENPNIENLFGDGAPEVSVFWDENQVRLKARIDLLRIRPVIDVKTLREAPPYRRFDQHVFSTMRFDRHDIQAFHLLRARHALALAISAGAMFEAGKVNDDWLRAVAEEGEYSAIFVYMQKTGAPIARPYEFRENFGPLTIAEDNWHSAVMSFHQWRNRFGLDRPWVNYDGIHPVLSDEVHKI